VSFLVDTYHSSINDAIGEKTSPSISCTIFVFQQVKGMIISTVFVPLVDVYTLSHQRERERENEKEKQQGNLYPNPISSIFSLLFTGYNPM
jgi:hypothetical protein